MNARQYGDTGPNGTKYRRANFQPTDADNPYVSKDADMSQRMGRDYLDGHRVIDRPLTVQFCANDENALLAAAKYAQNYCDAVDLNLGCPQQIARKGKYGAYLQEDWPRIYRMIRKLYEELNVPVTAKIRVLESKERTLQYAKMVLDAGASILTVHARTREQSGHDTGLADRSFVRYLRDNLPSETVIFANGNILEHDDIQRCLEETGADAVMIAEGSLTDPSIFTGLPPPGQEGREYWRGIDGKRGHRIDAALRRYIDVIWKYVLNQPTPSRPALYIPSDGPNLKAQAREGAGLDGALATDLKLSRHDPNLRAMKAHFFEVLRTFNKVHPHVQNRLHTIRSGDMCAFEEVLAMVEAEVSKGLEEYENLAKDGLSEEASRMAYVPCSSTSPAVQKCVKPWWCCQPYVRPSPDEARQKGATRPSKKQKTEISEKIGEQGPTAESVAIDG
ncbi:MAG: hypothetical protein Q9165_002649 [Trypethelium subeluteriae]